MIIKSKGKTGTRSICKCLNCNEDFSELNIKIKQGKGKFCCDDCYKQYRKRNAKDSKRTNCLYQKKHKYKLSEEEYNYLFEKQDNKCCICGDSFSDKNRACVDHNHLTDKVRGLLCSKCNSLLGMAKDSVTILNNAIKYLEDDTL